MVAIAVKKRFFKVVFGRDSLVVYTSGINSQAAIENACETMLKDTGEDYRRVPCVAYELKKKWVDQ